MEKKLNCSHVIWRVLLSMYIVLAISIFFIGKRQLHGDYLEFFFVRANFVPFRTIMTWLQLISQDLINTEIVVRNVLGNVVAFIPLSILLSVAYQPMTMLKPHLLLTASAAILIEITQSLCRIGYFDLDAVILRMIGALIGFLAFSLVKNRASIRKIKQAD